MNNTATGARIFYIHLIFYRAASILKIDCSSIMFKDAMDGAIFEIYSAYPISKWKFIQIKAVTYAGCSP